MPSYKLKYFEARGFGEVARLLFALAEQKYEDARYNKDTWPAEKPYTPFGQMPVLEVDGKAYSQSGAIFRYLARTFGYYGTSDIEALEIEQVLGIVQDIISAMIKVFYEKDETRKAEIEKENKEQKLPNLLGMLEKILKNNGSTGYLVGNKVSLADVIVYDVADKLSKVVNFDDYPQIQKCVNMVGKIPQIAAWIAKRPKTDN